MATQVLAWIRQRVHDDPQMLQAAAQRDPKPGEKQPPAGDTEVVHVLTRDHNHVAALVKQLSTIPGHEKGGSPDEVRERGTIVALIRNVLAPHEAAEQEHLWPAVRAALPDGDERAGDAAQQEQEGTRLLNALEAAEPDSDEFDDLVERLVLQLRKHVAFEEQVLLDVRERMPEAERRELGRRILAARTASTPAAKKAATKRARTRRTDQGAG